MKIIIIETKVQRKWKKYTSNSRRNTEIDLVKQGREINEKRETLHLT